MISLKSFSFIALAITSICLSTHADEGVYECQSESIGENSYHYRIEVKADEAVVYQASTNGRFAPIIYSIAPTVYANHEDAAAFECTATSKDAPFESVAIRVYESEIQVLRSSPNARYAPLAFRIQK